MSINAELESESSVRRLATNELLKDQVRIVL